jgi:nicotinate-nucleotide pyrophosphorylase (carboxylating)
MISEQKLMRKIIQLALTEDRVEQDVTTNSLLVFDREVSAQVIAKQSGIISGITVFSETFKTLDPDIRIKVNQNDGSQVKKGDMVLELIGLESSILKGERTALNFLQRLSGIASFTRQFVEKLRPYKTVLLDTRKTTPGMRYLEKKAVRDGGGTNHRLNLEDMAMIKDNHIRMAGSISKAINEVRKKNLHKKIEIEVSNITELKEALDFEVDFIMLDNFDTGMLNEAVKINDQKVKLEVSGNVTLDNIEEKAGTGVDFISVGALTHSFKAMDLSLEIVSDDSKKRSVL